MTDDIAAYGLGALPDAPDERDYPLSALYASEGLTASVVLPALYAAPGMPAVLDQRATPMCVAYSSSAMKAWQDRRDQERFFDFDEPAFFAAIGGTAAGRTSAHAMERMRLFGYPVAGSGDAGNHRIAAYYAVPRDLATIKAAIFDLGPIVVSTTWYRSWFHPAAGVLPRPDTQVGGHAIVAYGWDARGLRLRNSWGSGWGVSGDCWMPAYLVPHLDIGQLRRAVPLLELDQGRRRRRPGVPTRGFRVPRSPRLPIVCTRQFAITILVASAAGSASRHGRHRAPEWPRELGRRQSRDRTWEGPRVRAPGPEGRLVAAGLSGVARSPPPARGFAPAPDPSPGRLGRLDGLRGVSPRMPGARPTPVPCESPLRRR